MLTVTDYDVVIAGGGTAGVIAALASARAGAKTLVVERYGFLGGTLTACEVHQIMTYHASDGTQVLKGIAQEFIDRLQKIGGSLNHCKEQQGYLMTATPFDPELAKYVLFLMMEESGVEVLLHSWIADALVEKNIVKGIVVENKSGRMVIEAKVTIDTTGDADVVARAGGAYIIESKDNLQPMSLILRIGNVNIPEMLQFMAKNPVQFKFAEDVDLNELKNTKYSMNCLANFAPWKKAISNGELPSGITVEQAWFASSGGGIDRGEINVNVTRTAYVDGTDAFDFSKAEIVTHKQAWPAFNFFKNNIPGFENSYLIDTAPQIGIRETRRIVGKYTLTKNDIINPAKKVDDGIGFSACPIDIHQPADDGEFTWVKTNYRGTAAYPIPYGVLVPRDLEGILVAGRAISVDHEAYGSTRLIGTCFATGHAAGVAAALCAKNSVSTGKIDLKKVRSVLKDQGAVIS